MLVGKEPIHLNRIRSETHKVLEVTSQSGQRVHVETLELSQFPRKLPPRSVDAVTPSSFFVLKWKNTLSSQGKDCT